MKPFIRNHAHPGFWYLGVLVLLFMSVCVISVSAENYQFVKKWGSLSLKAGNDQGLAGISNIVVDSGGNVIVTNGCNVGCDPVYYEIKKFDANGNFLSRWSYTDPDYGLWYDLRGLALDAAQNIYVSTGINRLFIFSNTGTHLNTWIKYGWDPGQWYSLQGIAMDPAGSTLHIIDNYNRVQKYTTGGAWIGPGYYGTNYISYIDIAIDGSGNAYLTTNWNTVEKRSSTGALLSTWGSTGTDAGKFSTPSGICYAPDGYVYVADTGNNRIQKFTADGVFVSSFGWLGSTDGPLNAPKDVFVDSSGKIYVTDQDNHRIQVYTQAANPIVSGISPSSAQNSAVKSVVINGNGFAPGATVKLTKAGSPDIKATSVVVDSFTRISCNLPIKGASAGTYSLVVSNTDGTSSTKANAFTITAPVLKPTFTAISPKTGVSTKNTQVTITGNNFRKGAVVQMINGKTVRTATIKSISTKKIVCTLKTKGAKIGQWNIRITNKDKTTVTKPRAFTVKRRDSLDKPVSESVSGGYRTVQVSLPSSVISKSNPLSMGSLVPVRVPLV